MKSKLLLSVFIVFASCIGHAQVKDISQPKLPYPIITKGSFSGPFQDTIISVFSDEANSTICYVYVPVNLETREVCKLGLSNSKNGCSIVYPSGVGSISCVKTR
jgi:hypothetical protein